MAGPLLQEHPPPQEPPQLALLPPRTASLIRSSTIVPTLPSILSELVQNSIDARATAISCAVDLDTWTVRVEDNGTGIAQQDLALLRTAARHLTSKLSVTANGTADGAFAGVTTYGFRGEALASLQDVGTLEIRTKTTDDEEAQQLVLRGGECLVYGASRTERSTGTTVWVRDIFYKARRRSFARLHLPDIALTLTALGSYPSAVAHCRNLPHSRLSSPPYVPPSRLCPSSTLPSPSLLPTRLPLPPCQAARARLSCPSVEAAKVCSAGGDSFGVGLESRRCGSSVKLRRKSTW